MSKYSNYAIGVDISEYQTDVDFSILKKNIDFVIAKCGYGVSGKDKMFATHCQNAYDNNVLFLAYFWLDPIYYLNFPLNDKTRWPSIYKDEQLQNLIACLKYKAYYGLMIDFEQWWEDWSQWYEMIKGTRPQSEVKVIDPAWLSEVGKWFMDQIGRAQEAGLIDKVPVRIYTGNWFVSTYAPNSYYWIENSWFAHYCLGVSDITATWDEVKASYLPSDTVSPLIPGEKGSWSFWQFTGDQIIVPGIKGATGASYSDINLYNGTKEELFTEYKFTDSTEPTNPTEPTEPTDPTDPVTISGEVTVDLTGITTLLTSIDSKLTIVSDFITKVKEI